MLPFKGATYCVFLSHMFGTWSKNYWTDRNKRLSSAVRNFKFRYMFCRNKKDMNMQCKITRFLGTSAVNTNFGQYWLSFISWAISVKLS
jgi:hypothetical protein